MTTNIPKSSGRSVRNLVFVSVPLLMVALIAASLLRARSSGAPVQGTDATNATLVADGQRVYKARCASCHGANLEGQPNWQTPRADGSMPAPPHDASGHTWHHNDQALFATVKYGGAATSPPGYNNAMPALGNVLSDREIWAALSFIKSTWPPELQQAQERGHAP